MKQFSAEFKQDTVAYYYSSGKTVEQVAKELKVGKSTLGKLIRDARDNSGVVPHRGSGNYGSDLEKENARLKKELQPSALKKYMNRQITFTTRVQVNLQLIRFKQRS